MLRRIFAAAFSFAALTTTIGATSAVADEYGPDQYPCTIELSSGTVPENAAAVVEVSCDAELLGDEVGGATDLTLDVVGEDGEVVHSTTLESYVTSIEITELAPADYTLKLAYEGVAEYADRATLTIMPEPSEPSVPDEPSDPGKSSGGGDLAVTGATGLPYLAVAGGLLLAGIAALVAVRRARRKA